MPWWGWIIVGVVLLGAEMLAIDSEFYLAVLGGAALLTGAADGLGLPGPLFVEWALFGALSVVLLLGVRRQLYGWARGRPAPRFSAVVGELAEASERIEPGALGQATLRGSTWTARNVGASALAAGQRARVVRVDNLTIELRAEE